MRQENWRYIPNYPSYYQVSDLGNVKVLDHDVDYGNRICHRNERYLKQHYCTDGYLSVKLADNKQHRVHRLVALAFLGEQNGMEVDHINGIRDDNRLENLRWVTHRDNIKHTYELGNGCFSNNIYGDNIKSQKISIKNDYMYKEFDSIKRCAEYIKNELNLSTKIESMRGSLRDHSVNRKPYYGYYISFV